ncbi:MAG TPA: hypothetical protein VM165_12805 [Planctomycetaceae bacterium]|nr:hypothetical protein [Planctomycetaceae bacterium]
MKLITHALREFFGHWHGWVLCPLPALLLWRTEGGRFLAMGCFFIASATRVALAFRNHGRRLATGVEEEPLPLWRTSMQSLGAEMFCAWALFALLSLVLNDPRDFDVVILAFVLAVTSLCVTPYLTLLTQKVFASVVFTVFATLCTKLLGGVVVVLVYGWDASERGYTTMPFTNPNLLVWMIWLNSAVLCAWCYCQTRRRFQIGAESPVAC